VSNVSTITVPTQQFRLSFWHAEIARLIGEGLPNREIKKHVKISDSRLSILRANPLIKREAARFKQMHEDKYRKALEVFADSAVEMAHQTTALAKNPLMPGQVRLAAIQVALDHAEKLSPLGAQTKSNGGAEESFEMLLKMTRRQTGELDTQPQYAELSPERTEAELLEDSYDEPDGDDIPDCATVIDTDTLAEMPCVSDDAPPLTATIPVPPSVAASTTLPKVASSLPPPDPEMVKLQTLLSKLVV